MVMSANSKSRGSMCQLQPVLMLSPRAIRPFGMCGACLPSNRRWAMASWASVDDEHAVSLVADLERRDHCATGR
jgi:hypothetical protein